MAQCKVSIHHLLASMKTQVGIFTNHVNSRRVAVFVISALEGLWGWGRDRWIPEAHPMETLAQGVKWMISRLSKRHCLKKQGGLQAMETFNPDLCVSNISTHIPTVVINLRAYPVTWVGTLSL